VASSPPDAAKRVQHRGDGQNTRDGSVPWRWASFHSGCGKGCSSAGRRAC